MLPLQDVVPTRQIPLATLALMGVNVVVFGAQRVGVIGADAARPFVQAGSVGLLLALLFLWLFGDNVEARLGRITLVGIYLLGGLVAWPGGAGAVTAVLGAYFMLLPRSRVLTLAPVPEVLMEVPAVFFLATWAMLHIVLLAREPEALIALALAFAAGAVIARVRRRQIIW